MRAYAFFIGLMFFCSAQAEPIQGEACVRHDARKIHESLSDYDHWYQMDDRLRYELQNMSFQPIDMVKSEGKFLRKEDKQTDAVVSLVLQPVGVKSAELYPQFLIRCTTRW